MAGQGDGHLSRAQQLIAPGLPAIRKLLCAVKGAGPQWVQIPPGNWIAPPGSNRRSRGGNESAEAFGVEGRIGDLAIMQAVMEVNAEQAPKPGMQEPPRQ